MCRSAGWYPEPEVFWRDFAGQHLPSLSETKSQQENGLFETQTSIIITETSNQNISCYIRNTLLRQEKESAIYIAEKKGEDRKWKKCLAEAVHITLDPDTANPHLIISADCKSVRRRDKKQELSATSRGGFRYSPCVLGYEGFTSGRHYWGVEVGSKGGWAVGVARESVKMKEGVLDLKPEEGIWAIERQWSGQFWALSSPVSELSLSRKPEKIRVSLDYEAGLVEFFDADNVEPFFSFSSVSFMGEKIRPFFRVGGAGAQLRLRP
ncbi:butyrophilin subfamily 1 member A1-like [Emydura macquarii macquarii]|uniref:butyrophilin subfamily 1 member A1-like n=1 Tax=Emydura macquarii macquarii TaxID=1129001 RepID=UPI00352B83CD